MRRRSPERARAVSALSLCFLAVAATDGPAIAATDGPAVADRAAARAAVERAVPYLRTAGDRWVARQKCVSCHRVGNQLWALAIAGESGAAPDAKFAERAAWAVESTLAPAPGDPGDQGTAAGLGNREGVAQLLLAPGAAADPGERAALAALLRQGQRADGGWGAGGQLPMQKRPRSETDAASALWIALALLGEDPADPAAARAVRFADGALSGAGFAGDGPPPVSVEPLAARLLVATRRGETARRDRLIGALRERQRPDGGWGWLTGEESDALGAGLALFALLESGVAPGDPAAAAARRFLLATQRPDGAWAVRGTKAKRRAQVTETATYWGAAWATAALARGLAAEAPGEPDR